jgi:hypothetical protein
MNARSEACSNFLERIDETTPTIWMSVLTFPDPKPTRKAPDQYAEVDTGSMSEPQPPSAAVVAPIPRASVSTAVTVNPGEFLNCRRAYRILPNNDPIAHTPPLTHQQARCQLVGSSKLFGSRSFQAQREMSNAAQLSGTAQTSPESDTSITAMTAVILRPSEAAGSVLSKMGDEKRCPILSRGL